MISSQNNVLKYCRKGHEQVLGFTPIRSYLSKVVFAPIVEDGTLMIFFSFFLIGKISNAALGRSTTQSSTLENNATLAMDGRYGNIGCGLFKRGIQN